MARELMPKSGILMPYVVVTRDAAVVGVSTVDGFAGAIDLTQKYLTIDHANRDWLTKTEGASKAYVGAALAPIMEGALFKNDPYINNNTPIRSGGANGVESVDMIKVTDANVIKIGSYESSVQGVELHSAGRVSVVDRNAGGVETKYPIYSQRYRPEVSELPFAAIGSYVKDAQGRTIGVNRTGVNADITQMTQKVTFTQPPTVPDASQPYDAVNLRQLQAAGGGGGANMSGVMNNFIGAVEWFNGSRAKLPAGYVVADGQILSRAAFPDLWAAISSQLFVSLSESAWIDNPSAGDIFQKSGNRGNYSQGDGNLSTGSTFRVPDLNGMQRKGVNGFTGEDSIPAPFLRGDAGGSTEGIFSAGAINVNAVPNIEGQVSGVSFGSYAGIFGAASNGAFFSNNGIFPDGNNDTIPPGGGPASGRFNTLNFRASHSNGVYGRNNTTEVRPNAATGIWIIRASGSFVSANTNFSVIDAISNEPSVGTVLTSGVNSTRFDIGGAKRFVTNTYTTYQWGQQNSVTHINPQLWDVNGILVRQADFTFTSSGDLAVSGRTSSGLFTSKSGLLELLGRGGDNFSSVTFKNTAGTVNLGGVYTERNGDITINTTDGGQSPRYFQFLKDGSALSSGGWINTSDERIKTDIKRIENPLDAMKSIKGVSWKIKEGGSKTLYGFIAQDVEKVFPEAVSDGQDMLIGGEVVEKVKSVDTYGVAAALHHEAILSLLERIETLEKALCSK